MAKGSTARTDRLTFGLDIANREAWYVGLDSEGAAVANGKLPMTMQGLEEHFAALGRCRVVLEAGFHSPWVSRALQELGHEVIVANPRELPLIFRNRRKSDRLDAENLARLARVDPTLLHPIAHRGEQAQLDLAELRSRQLLVEVRTKLINHVRGAVKAMGERLPTCSAESFGHKATAHIPIGLRPALLPVLQQISQLTRQIRGYERRVTRLVERYPAARVLQQPRGVGPITALTFVLTIEDPSRFSTSRDVGAYLGLVPKRSQSGDSDPQLGISKEGDEDLRRLLVQCAHYVLGPFGEDSDLRRWGLRLRGDGQSQRLKRRAVVAVARKLAVLLHRLWLTGEVYTPLRGQQVGDQTA